MSGTIDLDAYFRRIGHTGATAPDAATLAALHRAHPAAIAFENLDPLLGRPVRLDAATLEDKLVRAGRGGYCFEHNLLFASVLGALGYRVTGLAARVVFNRPADAPPMPRTHMLLRIDLDGGPVVADVGFGGLTLTAPLRLEPEVEQETPHERFRLVRAGEGLRMEALIGEAWTPLYVFDLQAQLDPDIEMMNHFVATHPASVFRSTLMVARVGDGARYGLRNSVLSVHRRGASSERRRLESGPELRDALADVFAIALPDDPGLDAALARFAAEPG